MAASDTQAHLPALGRHARDEAGHLLQLTAVELIALSLMGKQFHWNINGPGFRELHLHLDEVVDEWRELSDVVARARGRPRRRTRRARACGGRAERARSGQRRLHRRPEGDSGADGAPRERGRARPRPDRAARRDRPRIAGRADRGDPHGSRSSSGCSGPSCSAQSGNFGQDSTSARARSAIAPSSCSSAWSCALSAASCSCTGALLRGRHRRRRLLLRARSA